MYKKIEEVLEQNPKEHHILFQQAQSHNRL